MFSACQVSIDSIKAEAAAASADAGAADAVRRLGDAGLPQVEIAGVCGVPLWTVRRLLALTRGGQAGRG